MLPILPLIVWPPSARDRVPVLLVVLVIFPVRFAPEASERVVLALAVFEKFVVVT